jgi:hypothetical protein
MAFSLDEIVPWGRSFDEYAGMFGLTEADLSGCILGCGDGPASFNAEASQRGYSVVSCDPIYRFSAAQIEQRIYKVVRLNAITTTNSESNESIHLDFGHFNKWIG